MRPPRDRSPACSYTDAVVWRPGAIGRIVALHYATPMPAHSSHALALVRVSHAEMPERREPVMALVKVDFLSTSLMRTVTINAIVPADWASIDSLGYARAVPREQQRPFKTLYLLHGVYGNYTDWVTRTRLQYLAESRNLAVIMPSGENGFYYDRADGARFGEFIGHELVEFTRKLFHLSCEREDTFIGGLSMGGYGAIVNALRHPETFSRVVALSSGLTLNLKQVLESTYDAPGILGNRGFYESVFGPLDTVRGSQNDYDALAERVGAAGGPRPSFYMACGEDDDLLEPNRAYRDKLMGEGFDVDYHEGPGVHNWKFWDTWIERSLDWLPLDGADDPLSSGNVS